MAFANKALFLPKRPEYKYCTLLMMPAPPLSTLQSRHHAGACGGLWGSAEAANFLELLKIQLGIVGPWPASVLCVLTTSIDGGPEWITGSANESHPNQTWLDLIAASCSELLGAARSCSGRSCHTVPPCPAPPDTAFISPCAN